jgi:lysozyme
MITVRLPDGRTVNVNTTDPKKAAEAAKKFLSKKTETPKESGTLETIKNVAKAAFTPLSMNEDNPVVQGISGAVESGARNTVQSVREDVGGTAGGIGGALAGAQAGAALGTPLGPFGTAAGAVIGGAAGGFAGELGGRQLGEAAGLQKESKDSFVEQARQAGLTSLIGSFIPVVGGGLARASQATRAPSRILERIAAGKRVPAAEAAKAQAGQDASRQAAEQGLGINQFTKNNMTAREAASELGLEKELFATEAAAGAPTEFGAEAVQNVRTTLFSAGNRQRASEILTKRQKVVEDAIAPTDKAYRNFADVKSRADTKLRAQEKLLRQKQDANEAALFTPKPANTNILASELRKALTDPKIIQKMSAVGAYDATNPSKLGNILAAIPEKGSMTTEQLANFMRRVNSQFVTKEDDAARQAFYSSAEPALRKLFTQAKTSSLSPAAREYASKAISYFDTRFTLADLGEDFSRAVLENRPTDVLRAFQSQETLDSAKRAFTKLLPGEDFADFMRSAVLESAKGRGTTVDAAALFNTVQQLNPDVAKGVLGAGYLRKLMAADTFMSAAEVAGTARQAGAFVRGERAQAGQGLGESVKSLGVNVAANNPLGVGAATANIGRNVVSGFFSGSIDNTLFDAVAEQAARQATPVVAYQTLGQAAAQAGIPFTMGYDSFQEQYAKAVDALQKAQELPQPSQGSTLDKLRGKTQGAGPSAVDKLRGKALGGQGGGPEELAPSMRQDDLGAFIDGLMGQDALGKTISAATAQDDLDNLIRMQMMEDTKVASKVSTRQEEGFRTRMYKDTNGFRTVGIGFNMDAAGARRLWEQAGVTTGFDDVLAGRKTISKGEAEALYTTTKTNARNGASRLVKNFNQLGTHQQDALADMVFQLGQAGAMAFARTRGLIEQGKFKEAAQAMLQSRNAKQTPNRVLRRAYMLENNVSLAEADAALVKAGKISRKESINSPQELSRLMNQVQVAAAPSAPTQPKAKPAPKKRVRYAEAKAKRGLA